MTLMQEYTHLFPEVRVEGGGGLFAEAPLGAEANNHPPTLSEANKWFIPKPKLWYCVFIIHVQ